MTGAAGLARYREVDVLTMTPGRRVVLLYNHLVLNLRQARAAVEAQRIETRSVHLVRALDILHELLASLDRERGGALADQLAALYVYFIGEIVTVDRRPSVARLDPVIASIQSLQDAWTEAAGAGESR